MIRLALTWILIALPSVVFAQLIPTDQIREIACNAFVSDFDGTETINLSDAANAPNFGLFDDAVGETASVANGLGSGTGIQSSQFTSTSIMATGSASANAETYEFDWSADASGRSRLDVTFEITADVTYTLSGMVAAFDNGYGSIELEEVGGASLHYYEGAGEEFFFDDNGMLPAGTYRLRAEAGGTCYADGFTFDYAFAEFDVNFSVTSATASPLGRELALHVGPNPVRDRTNFSYSVAQAGPVQFDVYDVRGRRVRGFAPETALAGSLVWDGRNDRGDRVPGGIYFLRMRSGDQVLQRKMAVAP